MFERRNFIIAALISIFLLPDTTKAAEPSCNDGNVIAQFEQEYICTIQNCTVISYDEFKTMSEAVARNRIQQLMMSREMWAKYATPAWARDQILQSGKSLQDIFTSNDAISQYINWFVEAGVQSVIATQGVVRGINATPGNYDPNLKMYTCNATLDLDNDNLVKILRLSHLQAAINSSDMGVLLSGMVSTNNVENLQKLERLIEASLQQIEPNIASSCFKRQVAFTVQPSPSGILVNYEPQQTTDHSLPLCQ
jgi:hypothetical protein